MELGLKIGERGTLREFLSTYSKKYLCSIGWGSVVSHPDILGINTKNRIVFVKTSYDSDLDRVLTYCGDKVWDIRKEKKQVSGDQKNE